MSTINVSFDTVTKQMSVTMDGNPVSDLSSVCFYRCYSAVGDCYSVEMATYKHDEETKTSKSLRITASEDGSLNSVDADSIVEEISKLLKS